MVRRILFFSPSWLGDAVMSLPTLESLRRALPDAHIGVVARTGVADLFASCGAADDVILYRRGSGVDRLRGYLDLIGRLRAFSADLAIVLPRSFGSAWTALLSDAPRRIGFKASGRDLLLTDAIERESALLKQHRVLYYRHLISGIATGLAAPMPRIEPSAAARESALRLLGPLATRRERLVGFIPGAQYGSAKQWPEERFVALGRHIRAELGGEVVLIGGPGDRDLTDRIRHEIGSESVIDLAGKTSISELAAVLSLCRFVVSNDTGAMHVSAAVGTPVIAIFGSTDPITTAPFGSIHTILREPVECSPCLLRTCPIDHRCMTRIGVDRVLDAVAARLATPTVPADA